MAEIAKIQWTFVVVERTIAPRIPKNASAQAGKRQLLIRPTSPVPPVPSRNTTGSPSPTSSKPSVGMPSTICCVISRVSIRQKVIRGHC